MIGTALTKEQMSMAPGEAISLAAVMAIMAIALMAVVVYRIFRAKGSTTVKVPGGWSFSWK